MTLHNRLGDELIPLVLGDRADGTPIVQHAGGDAGWSESADEGDDSDSGEEADEEDDEEDDEADEDGYVAPSREQWDRQQAAIRRNNDENKRYRLLTKQLKSQGVDVSTDDGRQALDDLLSGRGPQGDDPKPQTDLRREIARAVEREKAKVEQRYKSALARTAAKAALADAGWSGKNLDRVMTMINLDDVDIDEDGNVMSITEQVADIKADIPDWFKGSQRPAGEKRNGASDVDAGPKRTKSTASTGTWLEKVNKQMTGG